MISILYIFESMPYTFASDPNLVDILHLCASLLMLLFIIRDRYV